MTPGAAPRVRWFFALWPDAATRDDLARRARSLQHCLGGKMVAEGNLHLTLFFLGELSAAQQQTVAEVPLSHNVAFELRIDHHGYWEHNRIAWAAPSHGPPELAALIQFLGKWLRLRGFALEERPFAPHVTLLRKAVAGVPVDFGDDIVWPVNEFVLVRSALDGNGPHYQVLRRWPLSSSASGSR